MASAQNLILIGSGGRNSGKTFLASAIIKKIESPVIALKITSIESHTGLCPRGGAGCGACSINTDFCLDEETNINAAKDTSQLLKAGAKKVFWLRCLRSKLDTAFAAFLEKIKQTDIAEPLIICESNSLRQTVKPLLFIMIQNEGAVKKSAQDVLDKADITLTKNFTQEDIDKIIQHIRRLKMHT
ncbi:MAG: hypothetical protein LBV52_07190 [Spirochaetaceae bacterium]|jgi:DNA helicase TIP49 (TBP-interacting protein)|nr:hypothetical protein [Spirochaetaceae bacterium]